MAESSPDLNLSHYRIVSKQFIRAQARCLTPGISSALVRAGSMAMFGCTLALVVREGNSETNPKRRKTHEHFSENFE